MPAMIRSVNILKRIIHESKANLKEKRSCGPGYVRPWIDHRNNLDLATYDRMRVVTTELRRLLAKGRNIQLRLGSKVSLSSSDLQKTLRWVHSQIQCSIRSAMGIKHAVEKLCPFCAHQGQTLMNDAQ